MRKFGVVLVPCLLLFILAFQLLRYHNLNELRPDDHEIARLREFYGNLADIKDTTSLLKAQQFTIEQIEHRCIQDERSPIIIDTIIDKKAGFCYDRSLLLQKLLLMNGIEVRPIYIFFLKEGESKMGFFKKNIDSHSIFEARMNGDWVVVQTNYAQNRIKNLEEYLVEKKGEQQSPHYILHLNNRHGGFLKPKWLPDIY